MATLRMQTDASSVRDVYEIDLSLHTPLAVLRIIVKRLLFKKPPTGSIWIMKMKLGGGEYQELDHFITLEENGVPDGAELVLFEVHT